MEEQEFTAKKWRRGIVDWEKGGPSTPSITWRLKFPEVYADGGDQDAGNFSTIHESRLSTVSARKLGANLWEVNPTFSVPSMNNGRSCSGSHHANAILDGFHGRKSEQREGASSPTRCILPSLPPHHGISKRNASIFNPKYPATNSSSMEIASTNSLDFKDKVSTGGDGLKPSAELLLVLNRVWRLEEQNISNESLVKSLKVELDRSKVYINKLTHEKERNRLELDNLTEKFSKLKHVRKTKQKCDVREDDAKGEWDMKNLHQRLLHEISEIKSHFSDGFKQVERQKKLRLLLEYLCDELAMGVKAYERKIRSMKQVPGADRTCECPDRLVIHASETWLDGRAQMKLDLPDSDRNIDYLDKILSDIEACFRSRRLICSEKEEKLHSNTTYLSRNSLESFHLKESASAPRNADEDDSTTDMVDTIMHRQRREEVEGINDFQKLDTSDDAFLGDRTTERRRRDKSNVLGLHRNKESAVNRSLFRERTDAGKSMDAEMSGSSTKWLNGVKVDTLKEKLLEARFEASKKYLKRPVIKGAF